MPTPVIVDGDGDGISRAIELQAPNHGDGNRDGKADATQKDVASLRTAVGSAFVTIEAKGHTLANVHALGGSRSGDYAMLQGQFGFEVRDVAVGGTATVRLILPNNARPDAYLKEDPATGKLTPFTFDGHTGAQINRNIVTLHLVDGGRGDADGVANGVILDPGGPGVQAPPIIAVGPDAGSQPTVNVYDAGTHKLKFSFLAYAKTFTGGVRVAVGDVNADGYDDIITGAGVGGGSQVRVFSGKTGNPFSGTLGSFNAFSAGFTSGVYVAAGDVTGDGKADIIVGSDQGSASPKVRVFDGANGAQLFELTNGASDFTGGVRVAAGDVNGDGRADIITATGPGVTPRARVFDGVTHMQFYSFFAADPTDFAGLDVAAGDIDGDGLADIVTGSRAGNQLHIFHGSDTSHLAGFEGSADPSVLGMRPAVIDYDGDGHNDLAAAAGPGGGELRFTNGWTGEQIDSLRPYGEGFTQGMFVAASNTSGSGGITTLTSNPVVTIEATVPDTAEGSSTPGEFTITRTGDISQPLNITLGIGGTATYVGSGYSDYSLWPINGNVVAFISGVSSVVLTVTPVDDSVYEKAETVVLTIQPRSSGGTPPAQAYDAGNPSQAVVRIADNDGPAPTPPPCDCGNPDLVKTQSGVGGNVPSTVGAGGVRLFDGAIKVSRSDLSSDGFGVPWGFDWSWTNAAGYATQTVAGNGSVISQLPYLIHDGSGFSTGTVAVISNGNTARLFDGGTTPRFFLTETLSQNQFNKEFTFTDSAGEVFKFYNFDTSLPAAKRGQLKSFTDAAGKTTTVTAYTSDGKPQELQHSSTAGSTTITESYLLTYLTSGSNAGRISNVTLRRQVGTGSWTTVRQVDYSYYDGSGSSGTLGDLQKAVLKDGSGNTLDAAYYRYYTSSSSTGYAGGLKYVFNSESYGRLAAAFSDPTTATDAQVAPYADLYLEFDSVKRVSKAVVQGSGCSSCTGGLGTYTYSYTTSIFADGRNSWRTKTVETMPDGNQNIVYTNCAGEVILWIYKDVSTGDTWITFYKYDDAGRLIQTATQSAITGFDDTKADLLDNQSGNYQYLDNSAGRVENYSYGSSTTATSSTAGNVAGYQTQTSIQKGETGTAIVESSQQYFSRTGSSTIYPLASTTVYRNTDGTGGETTSFSYTWQGSTDQMESMTTTLPTISTSQNGPNSADSSVTYFDAYGRPIWSKDADGFLNYTEYDQATGAVTKTITDVDTTQTGDFSNKPSGWTTPSGGGLHLKSLYEVDSQGRTTKTTDPKGNITYTVYNDTNHETRTYQGWDSTNNVPTGPTQVYREDRAGSYTESLTMTATPHLTSSRPDGTESVSGLQTLSRTYTNSAGQVDQSDAYFNLMGLTYSTSTSLGTENTNFYRTSTGYDDGGRQDRLQSPTGTISRTVYDGQGRAVSEWVGTDDTPTSGEWSPSNTAGTNLVKVSENEYDSGGVGDGNLTKSTQFPGGSAANRVTQYFYDWRDRQVAVKSAVEASESTSLNRPITYITYDNLGQVTRTQMYDGDGVSITDGNSDGVPDAPSSSLLRAQSDSSYDEQGRVYQTKVYSVDPSNGTVSSNALTSNTWYNHRGEVIKTSQPGGLVMKSQYDGAGRTSKQFTTDGGGDSGWSDADDVTGDKVLSQTEMQNDAAGNAILMIAKDRFHDETATGELGNASTAPKARVSYSAGYYDLANRLTDSVNVGTNGGSSYTRPASVPSRSDTVLVSSYGYNAAGWTESVTDPRGIVGKTYYDNLGRTTKTIENYVDGTPSDSDDKTTEYTYDGSGHMLTLKADLTSGHQTTQWVYGTSSGASDDIVSNDVLKETDWPDPSSGNPSSSEKDVLTVNALGQTKTSTDRNGNVHTLSYDVLGRVTSDAVTTLGTNVDGSVRRIEYAYDGQGNAYLITSYDAASAGNIVNQIQRDYNGLGQLTKEYQSHSGAVNINSTPKVQYAYTEMSGGANHSRLTSITYPNGKVVTYNYSSGLNDTISRLSSLSDTSGTLESYDYLGLGAVVRRAHSQPGVDLTYIKQTGESNGDAGDQYTGLDRFGRVVDQRWIKTSSGTATDRFQYGYDRDGNRLWRDNLVNSAFGELYSYDNLNQITSFDRGTLNGTKTGLTGSASRSQDWDFDALGNFDSVTTDSSTQTRSHNDQNEITSISGATTPTYDSNGNMTGDETGRKFVYDAWNRLVTVKDSSNNVLESFAYDGVNRRVSTTASSTTTDLYYSAEWQVLEERVGGNAKMQYVWSPVYIDAMILRDRDTDANGSLDERLWVQQDANFNVTALVNGSGSVIERYAYDPFGSATVYDATWGSRSSSSYAWSYLHQGGRYDATSGLYHFRNRDYSAALGRWVALDSSGFDAGDTDLYRTENNSVINLIDPYGLDPPGVDLQLRKKGVWVYKMQTDPGPSLRDGKPGFSYKIFLYFPLDVPKTSTQFWQLNAYESIRIYSNGKAVKSKGWLLDVSYFKDLTPNGVFWDDNSSTYAASQGELVAEVFTMTKTHGFNPVGTELFTTYGSEIPNRLAELVLKKMVGPKGEFKEHYVYINFEHCMKGLTNLITGLVGSMSDNLGFYVWSQLVRINSSYVFEGLAVSHNGLWGGISRK